MGRILKPFDRRDRPFRSGRLEPEFFPVDAEFYVGRVVGPAGQGDEQPIFPGVNGRRHIGIVRFDRGPFDPEARHAGVPDPEFIPELPDRPWIPGPGQAVGHAEEHTPPRVPAVLEHLAHEAERDSGNLDQPVIGLRPVVEVLSEPEAVEEREMFEIEIGARGESVAGIVLIGRVEIDEGARPVPVENLADTLHRRPVEGDVVEVEPVDTGVAGYPVQSFDVIVVPPRHAAVDDGRVLDLRNEPGRDVIAAQVLLEPGEASAGPGGKHLVPQAAEREELGRPVGELADRIVDLDFKSAGVGGVDIGFHLHGAEERVVDERVDLRRVVDVDDVGARVGDLVERLISVIVPLGEPGGGVDRLKRRDENRGVEVKRFPGFEGPRTARSRHQDRGGSRNPDLDRAAAFVSPRGGQVERLGKIEVRVERPRVIFRPQRHLQAGVDVPDPECVLVSRPVPSPGEFVRTKPALEAQAHHEFRRVVAEGNLQGDVPDLHVPPRFHRHPEVDEAVEFHDGRRGQSQIAGFALGLPGDRPFGFPRDPGRLSLPRQEISAAVPDDELHGPVQDLLRGLGEMRHLGREKAADAGGETVLPDIELPAEEPDGRALDSHRDEWRDDPVVKCELRIEPPQAGHPARISVPVVDGRLFGDPELNSKCCLRKALGSENDRSLE